MCLKLNQSVEVTTQQWDLRINSGAQRCYVIINIIIPISNFQDRTYSYLGPHK